jgi:hypothetical protein
MDGCVDGNDRRPTGLKTLDALLAAVNGAIIHDPKNACRRPIGFLAHHFADQAIKGFDAVLAYTATEEFGATDIPRREVDPGSLSLVLMLDESRSSWGGRKGRVLTVTRLNPSLLVGGEHKIFGTKRLSLPETLVEIEDGTGLFHKPGITRKDPAAMPPRMDSVLAEPAPNGGSADLGH